MARQGGAVLGSVLRWRQAEVLFEDVGERRRVLVANLIGDGSHGLVGGSQQTQRFIQAHLQLYLLRGLAERGFEVLLQTAD